MSTLEQPVTPAESGVQLQSEQDILSINSAQPSAVGDYPDLVNPDVGSTGGLYTLPPTDYADFDVPVEPARGIQSDFIQGMAAGVADTAWGVMFRDKDKPNYETDINFNAREAVIDLQGKQGYGFDVDSEQFLNMAVSQQDLDYRFNQLQEQSYRQQAAGRHLGGYMFGALGDWDIVLGGPVLKGARLMGAGAKAARLAGGGAVGAATYASYKSVEGVTPYDPDVMLLHTLLSTASGMIGHMPGAPKPSPDMFSKYGVSSLGVNEVAPVTRAVDELPVQPIVPTVGTVGKPAQAMDDVLDLDLPAETSWYTAAPEAGYTNTRPLSEQVTQVNAEGQKAGPGHYIAQSKDFASTYGGKDGRMYEVQAPFDNPFDFNTVKDWGDGGRKKSGETFYNNLVKSEGSKSKANLKLQELGYDAITFTSPKGDKLANIFDTKPMKDIGGARD